MLVTNVIVKYRCNKCGYSYARTALRAETISLSLLSDFINTENEYICPKCRTDNAVTVAKITNVCVTVAKPLLFEKKPKRIIVECEWVCDQCGNVIKLENKGFDTIKEIQHYIKLEQAILTNRGCPNPICEKSEIIQTNIRYTYNVSG